MNVPMCNRCQTARFLKFTSFDQGQVGHVHEDGQLTGDRNGPIGPVVHYFCRACGTHDGHPVPEDWVAPDDGSAVEDAAVTEELRQRGEVWLAPHRRSVRTADGHWVIEARTEG